MKQTKLYSSYPLILVRLNKSTQPSITFKSFIDSKSFISWDILFIILKFLSHEQMEKKSTRRATQLGLCLVKQINSYVV